MPQAAHIVTDYLDHSIRVVALVGEHDVSNRQHVLAELERVIEPRVCVIVDLSDADFIDSSVLGVLVAAHKRAEWRSGTTFAVVVSPGTAPERLFGMTDARALFPTFSSLEEAVSSRQVQSDARTV